MIKYIAPFFGFIGIFFYASVVNSAQFDNGEIRTNNQNSILFEEDEQNSAQIIRVKPSLQTDSERDIHNFIEIHPEIYVDPFEFTEPNVTN